MTLSLMSIKLVQVDQSRFLTGSSDFAKMHSMYMIRGSTVAAGQRQTCICLHRCWPITSVVSGSVTQNSATQV